MSLVSLTRLHRLASSVDNNDSFSTISMIASHSSLLHSLQSSSVGALASKPSSSLSVSYTISLTSCSADPTLSHDSSLVGLIDGAIVLRHSILRSTPSDVIPSFKAFVHDSAANTPCEEALRNVGWDVEVVPTPIDITAIKTPNLRDHIAKNGCCGDAELIKFYGYTQKTEVVVMLDVDVLILKDMSEVRGLDSPLFGDSPHSFGDLPSVLGVRGILWALSD